MSLQLGGVEEIIRLRVDPREDAVVVVVVLVVLAEEAELPVELAVDAAAFRAFWSSRAEEFIAVSIVFRFA